MSKTRKEELIKRFEELRAKLEATKSWMLKGFYTGELVAISEELEAAEKES